MAAPRPTQAAIKRGIEAMQGAGLPVAALRVMRDGSVLILASSEQPEIPSDEAGEDAWDKAIGEAP